MTHDPSHAISRIVRNESTKTCHFFPAKEWQNHTVKHEQKKRRSAAHGYALIDEFSKSHGYRQRRPEQF